MWRDELLLGDWLSGGHRWTRPSVNSSAACFCFPPLVGAAQWIDWSQGGQGTFSVCVSAASDPTHCAFFIRFCLSLSLTGLLSESFYIRVYHSYTSESLPDSSSVSFSFFPPL